MISNRGKEISNRGRDYKSGQDRLKMAAGITNRCGAAGIDLGLHVQCPGPRDPRSHL